MAPDSALTMYSQSFYTEGRRYTANLTKMLFPFCVNIMQLGSVSRLYQPPYTIPLSFPSAFGDNKMVELIAEFEADLPQTLIDGDTLEKDNRAADCQTFLKKKTTHDIGYMSLLCSVWQTE